MSGYNASRDRELEFDATLLRPLLTSGTILTQTLTDRNDGIGFVLLTVVVSHWMLVCVCAR